MKQQRILLLLTALLLSINSVYGHSMGESEELQSFMVVEHLFALLLTAVAIIGIMLTLTIFRGKVKKTSLGIIIGFCVLLLGIAVVLFFSDTSTVGNQEILQEIERLSSLPYTTIIYDTASSRDFGQLSELTEEDPYAHGLVQETIWLAEHNESKHVGHALSFLKDYITTGNKDICIPHELVHIKLYIKHGDFELANTQATMVQKYHDSWKKNVQKQYEKYPQFYSNYEQLLSSIEQVIPRLLAKQYDNETIQLLDFVEAHEVC
ncbi:hypothetical protein HZB01_03765 [Candidatus Woesearchaeota archaeon]|nr:hypothetical protein [Candidatus Woesearchaeota archaeon]